MFMCLYACLRMLGIMVINNNIIIILIIIISLRVSALPVLSGLFPHPTPPPLPCSAVVA